MSGKKSKGVDGLFKEYRDFAPSHIDDDKIHELIKLHFGDREKIHQAIMAIWNDTPDRLASGSDWVTLPEKSKKLSQKENEKPSSGASENTNKRGKSVPPAGRGEGRPGRGNDASRGRGAGRGHSATRAPKPSSEPKQEATASSSWETTDNWDSTVSSSAPAPSEPIYSTPSSGIIAWKAGGLSLAEKLKRQDAEKALRQKQMEEEKKREITEKIAQENTVNILTYSSVIEEPEEEIVAVVADLTLNSEEQFHQEIETKIGEESILLSTQPAPLLEPEVPVSLPSSSSANQEEISDAYLKMGRWDTSQQTAPFQFGSFGKEVSSEDVSQQSWPSSTNIDVDTRAEPINEVWNSTSASAATSSSLPDSIFAQTKSVEPAKFDQKPPGLGDSKLAGSVQPNNNRQGANTNIRAPKPDAPVQASQPGFTGLPQGGYTTMYAPPGINAAPNVRGANTAPAAIPYYTPGYDQQFMHPGFAPVPPIITPSAGSTASATATTVPGGASTTPGQQPQQQQQFPQFQFHPYQSAFYNNYYYPNQLQSFYPGRGLYQPRGYAPDPYGGYDMYGQQGQFPDAYGNAQPQSSTTAGKNQKNGTANPAPAAGSNQSASPDVSGYGYNIANPYNQRADIQAWGYQSPAVWGGPAMMGYPAGQQPSQGYGQPPGVVPQSQPQPQQQPPQPTAQTGRDNSQRTNQGGNYGGSFGGRGQTNSTASGQNW